MKTRQWILAAFLLIALGAAVGGLVWTRDPGPMATEATSGAKPKKKAPPAPRERLVDTKPLMTARSLAALASTPEEQEFARQAEKLANHQVDLAFADALRQAADAPLPATEAIRALVAQRKTAEDAVEADQQRIKALTRHAAAVPEAQKDPLEDQLEVAKAQLELDQDELDAASEDLAQAGGDPQARIRNLKAAHEAADRDPLPAPAPRFTFPSGSLLARFGTWNGEKAKLGSLAQARQDALAKAQRLSQRRSAFAQRVQQETEDREAAKRAATGFARKSRPAEGGSSRQEAKFTVDSLKRFLGDQKLLGNLGKRLQDEQELAEVYGDWHALASGYARAALHRLIRGLLGILLTLLAVFILDRGVEHLFHGSGAEKLRVGTLRSVVKFALQVAGAVAILFQACGLPSQTTTILGLAGAGLTVALKDFIVAFFGWFVLMGRNGIRVGDWVEIKGVGGEVVEVGLLRTVLLETGSWGDAGHPTGRRVTFVNSFAIEGHFFNFSTSGQWMWDELRIQIPLGQDPYPILDGVQKLVEQKTQASAALAEQEWHKAAAHYRVQAFSAVPGINVVPTSTGIEIRVRYITRANERYEAQQGLYRAVVELMHGRRPEATTQEA